jgi:hypothetical protein
MLGPWTKSKWSYGELNDSTVEFQLTNEAWTVSGTGKFLVALNPKGQVRVDIVVQHPGPHWSQITKINYHLGQRCVSKIQKHSDQKKAKFRVEC